MGLFGKKVKAQIDVGGFLPGFLAGMGAPGGGQMLNAYHQRRQSAAEAEAEAAALVPVYQQIDADPNLSPEHKAYAKANPKAYIEQVMKVYAPMDAGAAGGSRSVRQADGTYKAYVAPSRHEYQGSVYDVGGGVPGAKAQVTPQHEGTQWVTPQPGTTAFGVNSFSGMPRAGEAATAPTGESFQPGQVVGGFRFKGGDDTDQNNWEPVGQGGAGQDGPRPFRPSGIFGRR